MKIDRMLSITILLLNRDRISAKELADRFEVSVRTIYRDIEAINMAGIPVISYPGNNGGFGIMNNYRLDRQLLTLGDMVAILSALKGIRTTLDYRDLDNAIEKITSLMPDQERRYQVLPEQLVIDIQPWGYRKKQRSIMKEIHFAVTHTRIAEFLYKNSRGQKIRRKVEPMTLMYRGFAWYLFAYCLVREDYRLFRLSRISDLLVMDETFAKREKSCRDILLDETEPDNTVTVALRFSPEMQYHVEDYFLEDQIQRCDDGSLIVRAAFHEDEWVYSMILSYGDRAEVLEPHHIRKIISEKAKKISALYKPDIQVSQV